MIDEQRAKWKEIVEAKAFRVPRTLRFTDLSGGYSDRVEFPNVVRVSDVMQWLEDLEMVIAKSYKHSAYADRLLGGHPPLTCAPGAHDPTNATGPCEECTWQAAVSRHLTEVNTEYPVQLEPEARREIARLSSALRIANETNQRLLAQRDAATRLAKNGATPEQFILKLQGAPYKCACGCNVFTKPTLNVYRCNACGECYEGTP